MLVVLYSHRQTRAYQELKPDFTQTLLQHERRELDSNLNTTRKSGVYSQEAQGWGWGLVDGRGDSVQITIGFVLKASQGDQLVGGNGK